MLVFAYYLDGCSNGSFTFLMLFDYFVDVIITFFVEHLLISDVEKSVFYLYVAWKSHYVKYGFCIVMVPRVRQV